MQSYVWMQGSKVIGKADKLMYIPNDNLQNTLSLDYN